MEHFLNLALALGLTNSGKYALNNNLIIYNQI
ncbi:hypothetical protein EZS27_014013 [termite gut metagenome]|uniref:Uncharacterized protein n=1 Tax=termite gut metagenome TaxID=433724 RepID=A0A5J4RY61_9ZZZZ